MVTAKSQCLCGFAALFEGSNHRNQQKQCAYIEKNIFSLLYDFFVSRVREPKKDGYFGYSCREALKNKDFCRNHQWLSGWLQ